MVKEVGRNYNTIHEDLKSEFKKVDVFGRRDDIDAYQAAQKLLDSYADIDRHFGKGLDRRYGKESDKELWEKTGEEPSSLSGLAGTLTRTVRTVGGRGKDLMSSGYYSEEIVKEYRELQSKLKEEEARTKENTRHGFWQSADKHVARLAARINEVENRVRQKREVFIDKQKQLLLIQESEGDSGKKYMIVNRSNKMEFCEDSNNVNILTAMSAFFKKEPSEQYYIDYANCGDEKLKEKIKKLCGSYKAIIQYDQNTGTCPLHKLDGTGVIKNAPIYQGVQIETLTQRIQLRELDESKPKDPINYEVKYKDINSAQKLIDSIPKGLMNKLKDKGLLLVFVQKCEARLDEILKKMKQQGSELDFDEPITRLYKRSGLMEAHFKNPGWDYVIFAGKETSTDKGPNKIPKELYDLLDKNEGDLKSYLKSRIKDKRKDLDNYAMRNYKVKALDKKVAIDQSEITSQNNQVKAISYFESALGHFAMKKYNKHLNKAQNHCKDMQAALQNISKHKKWVNRNDWYTQKDELYKLLIEYKHHDGNNASIGDDEAKDCMNKIFDKSASIKTIQSNIRELFTGLTYLDNASTNVVTEDVGLDLLSNNKTIDIPEYTVRGKDCEKCLKNINNMYKVKCYENGEIDPESKAKIDELYDSLDKEQIFSPAHGTKQTPYSGAGALYLFLQKKGLLPENLPYNDRMGNAMYKHDDGDYPRRTLLDKEMRKGIENLYNGLKARKDAEATTKYTAEDLKKMLKAENDNLETNMTPEAEQKFRINQAIMEDPVALEQFAKGQTEFVRNTIKYYGVNNMIHSCIGGTLVKYGGGFAGNNELQRLYNDAKGYGGSFDFADETWEVIGDHSLKILIEVAVAVALSFLTGGAGTTVLMNLVNKLGNWARNLVAIVTRIFEAIKGNSVYKAISKILSARKVVECGVRSLLSGDFKPGKFLSASAFSSITSLATYAGVTCMMDFMKEHINFEKIDEWLRDHHGDYLANIIGSITSSSGNQDISGESFIATVGLLEQLNQHPNAKMVVQALATNTFDVIVAEDNEGHFKSMDVSLGKDIKLKIDENGKVRSTDQSFEGMELLSSIDPSFEGMELL